MKSTMRFAVILILIFVLSGCSEKVNEKYGYIVTKDKNYSCSEQEEEIYRFDQYVYYFPCLESEHFYFQDENGNEYTVYELLDLLTIDEVYELLDGYLLRYEIEYYPMNQEDNLWEEIVNHEYFADDGWTGMGLYFYEEDGVQYVTYSKYGSGIHILASHTSEVYYDDDGNIVLSVPLQPIPNTQDKPTIEIFFMKLYYTDEGFLWHNYTFIEIDLIAETYNNVSYQIGDCENTNEMSQTRFDECKISENLILYIWLDYTISEPYIQNQMEELGSFDQETRLQIIADYYTTENNNFASDHLQNYQISYLSNYTSTIILDISEYDFEELQSIIDMLQPIELVGSISISENEEILSD